MRNIVIYLFSIVIKRRKATEYLSIISFFHHWQVGGRERKLMFIDGYHVRGIMLCALSTLFSWTAPTHVKVFYSSITFLHVRCLRHSLPSWNWPLSTLGSPLPFNIASLESVLHILVSVSAFLLVYLCSTEATSHSATEHLKYPVQIEMCCECKMHVRFGRFSMKNRI